MDAQQQPRSVHLRLVESTMAEEHGCMKLIGGKGTFYATRFKNFRKDVEMDNWRISNVVSIMGPQSGGKSTLLNHLFGTKFGVMDASEGRKQTTRGIWVAKSGNEPCTLVMDLEGTDGRERGENDTNFEKWSALFALAMSNIVLINMWCHDVGRENAANKPLLRTVFQVMLRICSPRKVTLMFVLRDKTTTPLNKLRELILEDMEKIWNSIGCGKRLEEFFDVKVEALCNYEKEKKEFKKQVAELKNKISGVDRDQSSAVTASVFSEKAKQIWKDIKDDRNLNIPCFKFLADKFLCEEIAKEKIKRFTEDYDKAKKGSGKSFRSLRKTYLSEYDKETLYCDKDVRSENRRELEAKMLQLKETDFNRNRGERATAALNVVGMLSAVGIAAAAMAIPGMQPLAVAMIPVIAGAVSKIVDKLSTRG